jgi:hypothetical protein
MLPESHRPLERVEGDVGTALANVVKRNVKGSILIAPLFTFYLDDASLL